MNHTALSHIFGCLDLPLGRELWKQGQRSKGGDVLSSSSCLGRLIKNLSAPKTKTKTSLILNNLKQAICSPTFFLSATEDDEI